MIPVIENELTDIEALEKLKECYHLRLIYIKTMYAQKNEYDKNEVNITIIKTNYLLKKLNKLISEKRELFNETFGRMIEELEFNDTYKDE